MMRIRPTGMFLILTGLAGLHPARVLTAADWPTWRGDAARSAVTPERLSADLALHWTLHLPMPRPAWPEEQGKVRFDGSYEPVAAGGHLFVPSMVDDSVTAYRLTDAALYWRRLCGRSGSVCRSCMVTACCLSPTMDTCIA